MWYFAWLLGLPLAAAFGEIAALRAAVSGGSARAAEETMESVARELEGSVLRGVIIAEEAGQNAAAAGFERRMERIAHALRHAIGFRNG